VACLAVRKVPPQKRTKKKKVYYHLLRRRRELGWGADHRRMGAEKGSSWYNAQLGEGVERRSGGGGWKGGERGVGEKTTWRKAAGDHIIKG